MEDNKSQNYEHFFAYKIKSLNLEWLRYYVFLAEFKNFSTAAKYLNVTQQTLSNAVSKIEEQIEIKLVSRGRNFEDLTPAGIIFLEKAKNILNTLYDTENIIQDFKGKEQNQSISVGFLGNVWETPLSEALTNLMTMYQNVFPEVKNFSDKELVEKLISIGEINIGLTLSKPRLKNISYYKSPDFSYVIVGKNQGNKKWNELKYLSSYALAKNVSKVPWQSNFEREYIANIDSFPVRLSLCKAGIGAMFVPYISVKKELINNELEIVSKTPFKSKENIYIIWSKDIEQKSYIIKFIEILKETIIPLFE